MTAADGLAKSYRAISPALQLPRPFDSSLGNNFTTTTCPAFFRTFLSDPVFQQCLPFSLLLQTSCGFFSATTSLVRINEVMDTSCSVDYDRCSKLMSSLAHQIRQWSNCGQDLQYENPSVMQAYNGFLAYEPLYKAGCLRSSAGSYCYGDAMTNVTSPSSSYIYFLPLGVQLPNSTQPSCNACLQDTMTVFAASAANASAPLSETYLAAAEIVDGHCGAQYADRAVQISAGPRKRFFVGHLAVTIMIALLFVKGV